MKKGPLSKAEKYYIENNTEAEVSVLAKDLDRSESTVTKHLKTIKKPTDKPDSSNLYARDSNKVATIMTEAASMAADESRKKTTSPQRYKGVIHTIKED
jgi:predicted transcriptional regulator|tara:strand:+ start:43 stop:339 length:297 start_codon:yes stop_codon:yes gene_type:complete